MKKIICYLMLAVVCMVTANLLTSCEKEEIYKDKPETYILTYTISEDGPLKNVILNELHAHVAGTLSKVATISPLNGMKAEVTFENWGKVEEGSALLSAKSDVTLAICEKYMGEDQKIMIGFDLTRGKHQLYSFSVSSLE